MLGSTTLWRLRLFGSYRAETVPRVTLPVPHAVTQVQFVADVGECDPIPPDQLRVAGGLWAAIRPHGVAKG